MKIPLSYQRTDYDCGPTTLLNAVSFQFEREEIPPEMLKLITIYATDHYSTGGEHGKGGTSRLAMMFISGWLNEYGKATGFPIETEYLSGSEVTAGRGSRISLALSENAAVVVRLMHSGDEHYILLTGSEGDLLYAWDPYYTTVATADTIVGATDTPAAAADATAATADTTSVTADTTVATTDTTVGATDATVATADTPADIRLIADKPFSANRCFPVGRLNDEGCGLYNMGSTKNREAVILYNKNTRLEHPYEPEYAI